MTFNLIIYAQLMGVQILEPLTTQQSTPVSIQYLLKNLFYSLYILYAVQQAS